MEEYLKLLLEQVRCKKAHSMIREELKNHMEDQIEANRAAGMSQEEAEQAAVADMGSPVEAGVELDRIHRPKPAWGMIGLMAVITIASIIIHSAMGTRGFTGHAVLGFVLMIAVYFLDYTFLAGFAKPMAVLFLLLCCFGLSNGTYINGMVYSVRLGSLRISLFSLMLLYVPIN